MSRKDRSKIFLNSLGFLLIGASLVLLWVTYTPTPAPTGTFWQGAGDVLSHIRTMGTCRP